LLTTSTYNIDHVDTYDEYKLGDICEFKGGFDFYRKDMDKDKYYKEGINYPLLKINTDVINDYVIINKKYDKYIVNQGDLVISTKGSCGRIKIVDIATGYYKHGLLKLCDFKYDKQYIYYYILMKFDESFIDLNTNKSVLSNMKKENLINTVIRILKPEIIQKYNLDKDFEFMDNLRNDIKNMLKNQENITKQMMKLVMDLNKEKNNPKKNSKEPEKKQVVKKVKKTIIIKGKKDKPLD
jgi:hypothetical protein